METVVVTTEAVIEKKMERVCKTKTENYEISSSNPSPQRVSSRKTRKD